MKAYIKDKWIKALKSGEYKKTESFLRTDKGYCCLGVLCDLYHKETGKGEWEKHHYDFGNYYKFKTDNPSEKDSKLLPFDVVRWAGLPDQVGVPLNGYGEKDIISALNDAGFSFNQLTKVIEEQFDETDC